MLGTMHSVTTFFAEMDRHSIWEESLFSGEAHGLHVFCMQNVPSSIKFKVPKTKVQPGTRQFQIVRHFKHSAEEQLIINT